MHVFFPKPNGLKIDLEVSKAKGWPFCTFVERTVVRAKHSCQEKAILSWEKIEVHYPLAFKTEGQWQRERERRGEEKWPRPFWNIGHAIFN